VTTLNQANRAAETGSLQLHHPRPLLGIALCLCSLFCFACLDTTTKYLVASYNVPLVVAIRYIVNLALLLVILAPRHGPQLIRTERTALVWVRAGCLACVSLFLGLALQRMPVAEATAMIYVAPMLVVLFANPLLGERIGVLGWLAAVTGFLGVLLVARPGTGLDTLGVVLALCAAAMNATYQLMSRMLARTERTIALLFYAALAGSIFFGLGLPWYWEGAAPSNLQILLFISLGVSGGLGHYFLTASYRFAPASLLAPVSYMQLLWAGLLGWMVFGHVPDGLTGLGMLVIMAAGVMIAFKSRGSLARG
jgi:drug/metabolite transporter (DMT)-like permease